MQRDEKWAQDAACELDQQRQEDEELFTAEPVDELADDLEQPQTGYKTDAPRR
jgi:hypothetical protein